MGTRGAVGIVNDKKWYVTYSDCDSYPEHLGANVVDLCRRISREKGWDQLRERIKKVKKVAYYEPAPYRLQLQYAQFSDLTVSSGSAQEWYCLLRKSRGHPISKNFT